LDTGNVADLARRSGFANLEEMRELLQRVPLHTSAERNAYELWVHRDATKAGLLLLIEGAAGQPAQNSGEMGPSEKS
jgi:hypothetical protein